MMETEVALGSDNKLKYNSDSICNLISDLHYNNIRIFVPYNNALKSKKAFISIGFWHLKFDCFCQISNVNITFKCFYLNCYLSC